PRRHPMHRKTLLAVALLASLAATTAIAAQDGGHAGQPARASLDANHDGVIDKSDAAKHPRLAAKFDQLDTNKDGWMGADERPRRRHGGPGPRADGHGGTGRSAADGDGGVSRA